MYSIGIDIGTSTICGVAYDPDTKERITIVRENNTALPSVHPWEKAQDADKILEIVTDTIRELRERCTEVRCVGLSGQMHGVLYVDRRGMAVNPLYTWQDGRGNLPYAEGESYADFMTRVTRYPSATGFGLVTHFYNLRNRAVPASAHKLCTVMDYVAARLCGLASPLTDASNAAAMGLFDKKESRFDERALNAAGIDRETLPEVVPSGTLVGLCEGVPVYVPIGDNQAAFLGSVSDPGRSIHVTVGTSGQISVHSDRYIEAEGLDTRPLPGGGYILVGASLCGGVSFAMLKDFFARAVTLFTGERPSDEELYRVISGIPYPADDAEDGLRVETLFAGTRLQPERRGSVTGVSLSNLTPENLIRGFAEGISQELYDFYQLLPEQVRREKTLLIGSGNGIKKNALLRAALERRFGCPLRLSDVEEEAAFGACVYATRQAERQPANH